MNKLPQKWLVKNYFTGARIKLVLFLSVLIIYILARGL